MRDGTRKWSLDMFRIIQRNQLAKALIVSSGNQLLAVTHLNDVRIEGLSSDKMVGKDRLLLTPTTSTPNGLCHRGLPFVLRIRSLDKVRREEDDVVRTCQVADFEKLADVWGRSSDERDNLPASCGGIVNVKKEHLGFARLVIDQSLGLVRSVFEINVLDLTSI